MLVAVEVRNRELLAPDLARMLRRSGATYCLGLHAKMLPIATAGLPAIVTINNKAEGSAPLSVLELARAVADKVQTLNG